MVLGFIIFGLFSLILAGNIIVMIDANNNRKKELIGAGKRKVKDIIEKFEKSLKFFNVVAFICIVAILFSLFYISAHAAKIESIPETEVVETQEESTSAPVDTIVPIVKNAIHIEELAEIVYDPDRVPVTEAHLLHIDPWELEMLACVIYQEAGGDRSCDNCRWYVAEIVLNRVNQSKFPNTIEKVLTAPGQYGELYWTGIKWPARAKYDTEKYAVERAYEIAGLVLSGQHSSLYGKGYIWQAGFKQGTDGFWCCGHYYGKG